MPAIQPIKRAMKSIIPGAVFALFLSVFLSLSFNQSVLAQSESAVDASQAVSPVDARPSTGGAQTLEDILRRQRGEPVDDTFRRAQTGSQAEADAIRAQLGTRGGASDSDVYRQIRFGEGDISVSTGKQVDAVLIQNSGMQWLEFRTGPLAKYGGYGLLGTLALLAVFFVLRGRIKVDHGLSGQLIQRFNSFERFGHWLLAVSFILLGLTGLWLLFGRIGLIELVGAEFYSNVAIIGKWIHNNVAWAFMLAIVIIFFQWVFHNIPNRHDLMWILKGGGVLFKGVHPSSKKFNAGQKLIFWSVIILGGSISASGISLLFPFEYPMFAKTFEFINAYTPMFIKDTEFFRQFATIESGRTLLPTELQPHQEMQYAQLWHTIVAFAMMAIILAHIYIGSIGMQGAFSAMGSGKVDRNWALEHHDLWVADYDAKHKNDPKTGSGDAVQPAE